MAGFTWTKDITQGAPDKAECIQEIRTNADWLKDHGVAPCGTHNSGVNSLDHGYVQGVNYTGVNSTDHGSDQATVNTTDHHSDNGVIHGAFDSGYCSILQNSVK